jgi:creatinine amidohydrolase
MSGKPYLLEETTWKTVIDTNYQIAVIPWGALEPHNFHLPYGTDNIQNKYVVEKAAEKAWNKGVKLIVLPNVPFGVNTGQLDLKLTINMNPSTQLSVLNDIIQSLTRHDIKKIIIFNGHGGNDFKPHIRELSSGYQDSLIVLLNWYQAVPWGKYFKDLGDHAGEVETSVMMQIAPDLVLALHTAGDGKAKKMKFLAKKEGWVWAPRKWSEISHDTGVGNPRKATAEKGEEYIEETVDKITNFFIELNNTPLDDLYE